MSRRGRGPHRSFQDTRGSPRQVRGRARASSSSNEPDIVCPAPWTRSAQHVQDTPGPSRGSETPRTIRHFQGFLGLPQYLPEPVQHFEETLEASTSSITPMTVCYFDFPSVPERSPEPAQHFRENLEAPVCYFDFPSLPERAPQPSHATPFDGTYNFGADSPSNPTVSNSRGGTQVAVLRDEYEQAQRRIQEAEASPLYQGLLRDRRTVDVFETILSYFPAPASVDAAGRSNERQTQGRFNQLPTPEPICQPSKVLAQSQFSNHHILGHTSHEVPPPNSFSGRSDLATHFHNESLFSSNATPIAGRLRTDQTSSPAREFLQGFGGRSEQSRCPRRGRNARPRLFSEGEFRHSQQYPTASGSIYPRSPLSPVQGFAASHGPKPVPKQVRRVLERAMQRRANRIKSVRGCREAKRPERNQPPGSGNVPGRSAPDGTPRYYGIDPPAELLTGRYECPFPWTPLHRSPSTPDFVTPASTPISSQQPCEINFDKLAARLTALDGEHDAVSSSPRTPPASSRPLTHQPFVEDADEDEADSMVLPD